MAARQEAFNSQTWPRGTVEKPRGVTPNNGLYGEGITKIELFLDFMKP